MAKLGENITARRFARFKAGAPHWTVAQTKPVEAAASNARFTGRKGKPHRAAPWVLGPRADD